jgi:hypothetical protein
MKHILSRFQNLVGAEVTRLKHSKDQSLLTSAATVLKEPLLKILLVGVGVCTFGEIAFSQSYSIDWSTIDGGGGTSAGGPYSLSATIGQPDAGPMLGGGYSLSGGFWSIEAIALPGVPKLFIMRSGTNAVISWTPSPPGFFLQGSSNLSAVSWADAPSGSTNPAAIPASTAARFYRLRKP